MIEIKKIHKIFNPGDVSQISVFDDFSFSVENEQFVSIVGSNGSGKTTLLNIICGSIPIDRGEILVDGKNIVKMPEYKRMENIGRVYQNPAAGTCSSMNIIENMSLADNKNKPYGVQKLVDRDKTTKYKEMLKTLGLGLENRTDVPMGKLSGGQRQAVALLMATMNPIKFLILDEHTAALDPKTADIIMELTDKVVKEKKLTAIMVTHNLRYAVEYGNRLIMMHNGNIVMDKNGKEKENTKIDDILSEFTKISIECGN